jgi:hypothetical protein
MEMWEGVTSLLASTPSHTFKEGTFWTTLIYQKRKRKRIILGGYLG